MTSGTAVAEVLDKGGPLSQQWLIGLLLVVAAWLLARWRWWSALIYWIVPAVWGGALIFMFYDPLMGDAVRREAPSQHFLGDWVVEGTWVFGISMIASPLILAGRFWAHGKET